MRLVSSLFFFFNDTATTEIYTLSLHDALPILRRNPRLVEVRRARTWPKRLQGVGRSARKARPRGDRKSTRLNSSHANISYAVFCLKKKKHVTRRNKGAYATWQPSYTTPTS